MTQKSLIVVYLLVCFGQPSARSQPVLVGGQKQLLADNYIVADVHKVSRSLGKVAKANGGKPLSFTRLGREGRRVPIDVWPLFASVYYDAQRTRFRMWHRISFQGNPDRQLNDREIGVGVDYLRGYSESRDGLHFDFVSDLKGLTSSGDTNLAVTIDDHETDPNHRYKIGYDSAGVHAAALAHSADGIHWTPYNDGKPVTYRASDFPNQIVWDDNAQAYRLFTRTDFGQGGGPFAGKVDEFLEVRGVRSMVNADVKGDPTAWVLERHWLFDGIPQISKNRPPMLELLKDPAYVSRARREAYRRQIYAMTDWTYEGIHFALMAVLEWPADVSEGTETDHVTRHERSIENYYIATSRDAISWDFRWVYAGQPLVPRGPSGAWDKDMIFPTSHIVTFKDRHWIYYGGTNERHGAAEKDVWFERDGTLGLAWLRLDGFVGLRAGEEPGWVKTRPFKLEGKRLEVNVDAREGGTISIEVLDEAGQAIEGFSRNEAMPYPSVDELRLRPRWGQRDDLSALAGRTIRLRFHLQNAVLYAFQIL